MKDLFQRQFGHRKFMIGCVHTLALPGTPLYDQAGGMKKIIAQARQEARILEDAGFHALLYTNEADMPYQTGVSAEVVAAMSTIIAETQHEVSLPHGVNILIDPLAALAVAHATGGRFIRAFVSGTMVGDFGFYTADGGGLQRFRRQIGADEVKIIANITPGFSVNLDTRAAEEIAWGAVFIGMADAVCISGIAAGVAVNTDLLGRVAAKVTDTPVVVGTGTTAENVTELAQTADGFIVGTSIKTDGKTLNPVDPERARRFMTKVAEIEGGARSQDSVLGR
ncbi:MAG: BtpA/SgcQ family protein [Desulfobacterales bacterium]|nr:MAG: BtpA/SgcQ family protein [Desulfobacterales bacterium]